MSGYTWQSRSQESVTRFMEPRECLAVEKLPEGERWLFEIKLDGCRMGIDGTCVCEFLGKSHADSFDGRSSLSQVLGVQQSRAANSPRAYS